MKHRNDEYHISNREYRQSNGNLESMLWLGFLIASATIATCSWFSYCMNHVFIK